MEKDDPGDNDRDQSHDKDSCRRDIFGSANAGTMIAINFIREQFQGRIEGLGGPDNSDAEKDGNPFPAQEMEIKSYADHAECGSGMQPGIALSANQEFDPLDGIADAAKARGKEREDHGKMEKLKDEI